MSSVPACNPVIVIGMHRSGTSMIIRMLRRMGLFTGWELDANGEAIYFVLRNRAVLESQGARWDRPGPIDVLLDDDSLRRRMAGKLRRQLSAPCVASYLGPGGYLRHRSLERLDRAWGWKDPRNTLLLRLWLEIFPAARVVHVVRNGVDVALSLKRREQRRLDVVAGGGLGVSGLLQLVSQPPEDCSPIAWAFSQVRLRIGRRATRRRLVRLQQHAIIEPTRGFELWQQYVARAEAQADSVLDGMLRVRYEDVLENPAREAQRLARFCCLDVDRARLERATALVDTERPAGPGSDPAMKALLEEASNCPWLRELGYRQPAAGEP
jgi:hypothetical protein